MSNTNDTQQAPVQGRLVRSAKEARELFNLRPKQATLARIRERQIASELTIERHGRDLLL